MTGSSSADALKHDTRSQIALFGHLVARQQAVLGGVVDSQRSLHEVHGSLCAELSALRARHEALCDCLYSTAHCDQEASDGTMASAASSRAACFITPLRLRQRLRARFCASVLAVPTFSAAICQTAGITATLSLSNASTALREAAVSSFSSGSSGVASGSFPLRGEARSSLPVAQVLVPPMETYHSPRWVSPPSRRPSLASIRRPSIQPDDSSLVMSPSQEVMIQDPPGVRSLGDPPGVSYWSVASHNADIDSLLAVTATYKLAHALSLATGPPGIRALFSTSKSHRVCLQDALRAAACFDPVVRAGRDEGSAVESDTRGVCNVSHVIKQVCPSDRPELEASYVQLFALGGQECGRHPVSTVERFDTRRGYWEPMPQMPTARSHCAAAVLGGAVYCVGGLGGRRPSSVCERFIPRVSPAPGKWEQLPSMSTGRSECGLAVADGQLYVLGGETSTRRSIACEAFDPNARCWKELSYMIMADGGCAAAAAAGKVYAVMRLGATAIARRNLARCTCFDLVARRWEALPPMRQLDACTARLAAATLNGKLYVIGESSGLITCFEPVAGRWDLLRPRADVHERAPTSYSHAGAAAAAGRIFIVGGYDPEMDRTTAASFDLHVRRWEALPHLSLTRIDCAVAAIETSDVCFGNGSSIHATASSAVLPVSPRPTLGPSGSIAGSRLLTSALTSALAYDPVQTGLRNIAAPWEGRHASSAVYQAAPAGAPGFAERSGTSAVSSTARNPPVMPHNRNLRCSASGSGSGSTKSPRPLTSNLSARAAPRLL